MRILRTSMLAALGLVAGCASAPETAQAPAALATPLEESFEPRGQAGGAAMLGVSLTLYLRSRAAR